MDTVTLISTLYKQEIARVVEQQILQQAQSELYKMQLQEKEKEIESLRREINELKENKGVE